MPATPGESYRAWTHAWSDGSVQGRVLVAFMAFLGDKFNDAVDIGRQLPTVVHESQAPALLAFGALVTVLFLTGLALNPDESPGKSSRSAGT